VITVVRGTAVAPAAATPALGGGIPEIPSRTSPNSARLRSGRCRASSGCPGLRYTGRGSTSPCHPQRRGRHHRSGRLPRELDTVAKAEGYRVTLLAFLMKASVSALREFPVQQLADPEKDALIYKSYYHLGVAVDTPRAWWCR